jgi:Glycosyl transferase family 2
MDISVALSSYNPRMDYLSRVLQALREQTLPADRWELIVVDNASKPPLEGRLDLSGLPAARIMVELKQGLSHARRRGFQEARADLIVNLDDDTVLDLDYLERTVELAAQYPFIGAFGCQIRAEFEQPPAWPALEYYAAERVIKQDLWSNDPEHFDSMPWGTGSVVRKVVAEAYVVKLAKDERFALLGRTPEKLLSCEDNEIALTACDLGMGKGVFAELRVTHLIPIRRMSEEFLRKNTFGSAYSGTIHNYLRFQKLPPKPSFFGKLNRIYRLLSAEPRKRKLALAAESGCREALRDMQEWGWLNESSSQS